MVMCLFICGRARSLFMSGVMGAIFMDSCSLRMVRVVSSHPSGVAPHLGVRVVANCPGVWDGRGWWALAPVIGIGVGVCPVSLWNSASIARYKNAKTMHNFRILEMRKVREMRVLTCTMAPRC